MTTILPNPTTTTTIPPITATTNPNANAATVANAVDNTEIASNFTTFLQLLTTQLKNQDPLSPMDTNQFTQQLVEFAGVEQQMKTNTTLSTLVSLQQSAQTSQALTLVGATVVVNGTTAQLANGQATWMLNATQPATATVTITAPNGQTAFSTKGAINSGSQPFTWNGVGNDGTTWPAGNYTLTATAVTASGQSTPVTAQVEGRVNSVDLTQTPPVLSIGGQNYTINDIQQIIAPSQ
ncbi:MAG TPA: flagellar hook capping FlgD N-terminal domain-containing protein [Pseudolabrys sp.]|jgi:flagellar basal-body rod modification protein FlgD